MGDRANVVFSTTPVSASEPLSKAMEGNVVLYSHWGGSKLAVNTSNALLKARPRWSDYSYATRIMVSQIVGKNWTEETGFGLYVGELGDNEHNILVVDFPQKLVHVFEESGQHLRQMEFNEFIGLGIDATDRFYN